MTIISFKHNFIFIKTSKTAGTSIEVDLEKIAGPDAVVTPIIPAEPGHSPRNHLRKDRQVAFSNHMRAVKIRALIGAQKFTEMFKFCVEREPVAKCISHFHMLRNSSVHNKDSQYTSDWQDYCDEGNFPINVGLYCQKQNGSLRLLVDKVLPYEDIGNSLPQLLKTLGADGFALTSRAKSGYAKNQLIDRMAVTENQRRTIYTAFAETCTVTGLYPDPEAA